jgi:tRNA pseudouridine38-40 synthase
MRAAARVLLGHHDFSAFRAAACTARDPWRNLFCLRLIGHAERLVFVLSADGFLQHMARTIVGTLVAMGRAQIPADAMATILQSRQRQYAGPTAPAHGLFLVRVVYDTQTTVRA